MKRKFLFIFLLVFLFEMHGVESMSFELKSQAFDENGPIPSRNTCDGKNVSPPLSWGEAPQGTECFVLIVDDPDAPSKTWVHWIVYNIPKAVREFGEGKAPEGALQGINDFGKTDYGGPCPPSGTHRYFFKLYALDQLLDLPEGASKSLVEKEMKGHIITEARLIGTYRRE